jgi:ComF family protein
MDLPKGTIISFVPLHKKRLADRGFNQSEEMAKYLAMKLDLPFANLLERRRETASQVGKNRAERIANMQNAFAIKLNLCLQEKNVLLIDDDITSGATIYECGKVLKEAGFRKVFAAVVARNR